MAGCVDTAVPVIQGAFENKGEFFVLNWRPAGRPHDYNAKLASKSECTRHLCVVALVFLQLIDSYIVHQHLLWELNR